MGTWIDLNKDRYKWWVLENRVMNLLVLWNQKIHFQGPTKCIYPYSEYGNESFGSIEPKDLLPSYVYWTVHHLDS